MATTPDRTLYMVLGCTPASTAKQVRAAYLALAIKHHPDKGGDGNRFREITGAYAVLKDVDRRALYDRQLGAQISKQCTVCHGSGETYKTKGFTKRVTSMCGTCGGTGRREQTKIL